MKKGFVPLKKVFDGNKQVADFTGSQAPLSGWSALDRGGIV
jgi:hypothetical protein